MKTEQNSSYLNKLLKQMNDDVNNGFTFITECHSAPVC